MILESRECENSEGGDDLNAKFYINFKEQLIKWSYQKVKQNSGYNVVAFDISAISIFWKFSYYGNEFSIWQHLFLTNMTLETHFYNKMSYLGYHRRMVYFHICFVLEDLKILVLKLWEYLDINYPERVWGKVFDPSVKHMPHWT